MKKDTPKLTLADPVPYKVTVPGHLEANWAGWEVTIESEGNRPQTTTLIGIVDQAALHGLLRQLYSLGLPLLSVNFIANETNGDE